MLLQLQYYNSKPIVVPCHYPDGLLSWSRTVLQVNCQVDPPFPLSRDDTIVLW